MASNSSAEYRVIADQIVSPDEDIIVKIDGAIYKGSISEQNRYVTVGDLGAGSTLDLGSVSTDIIPSVDDEYTLGSPDFRWKNIYIGPGTIYITDSVTDVQVALTISDGVFFLDGIAQAQLPELITNSIQLHDGNDNVVLRLVEDAGTGKIYFGGGTNGIWQDGGKTYITGVGYHAQDSGIKPMYYNSATGEITYDSDAIADTLEYVSSVPAHNYGSAGDEKNNFAYDGTYLYICTADYVNNSTPIWKRISFASGSW